MPDTLPPPTRFHRQIDRRHDGMAHFCIIALPSGTISVRTTSYAPYLETCTFMSRAEARQLAKALTEAADFADALPVEGVS